MREINFVVGGVIKPILKGYSPVLLILKRNWQNIIGEKYFTFCEPEKIYFQKDKKNSGTLYLTAFNTVVSFYIENNKPFISEKINSIFGYSLIVDIKIKQNPKIIGKKSVDIQINPEKQKLIDGETNFVENEELRSALRELGLFI